MLQGDELEVGGSEGRLKEAAIFEGVFAGIPFHETEIENFFGFEGAYAAAAGAEAVDQPGKLEERRKFEYLQATSLAEAPRRGNSWDRRHGGRRLARGTPLQ